MPKPINKIKNKHQLSVMVKLNRRKGSKKNNLRIFKIILIKKNQQRREFMRITAELLRRLIKNTVNLL